jgi:sterol desaturase/sphingolipid hydroxylase (fatty acid hydroxylase superfamily)
LSQVWSELLACGVGLVYACFFEWLVHRYFMHARRFPLQDAFRGHMSHHQIYRGDHRFTTEGAGHSGGIALRWYAFPGMLIGHMPVFLGLQWLLGVPVFWGGCAACTLYFTGYEFSHYLMHAPRGHFIERIAAFRFIREHHRLHHQYMRCNYNVFSPLADACLGTLRTKG